jgi:hypothetical protein
MEIYTHLAIFWVKTMWSGRQLLKTAETYFFYLHGTNELTLESSYYIWAVGVENRSGWFEQGMWRTCGNHSPWKGQQLNDRRCGMSVLVFEKATMQTPDECRRSSGSIGLACMREGGPLYSVVGQLRAGCREASAGGGLSKGWDDCFQSQLTVLLLGGSLLPCALQMLSWTKCSSDWLTSAMWSAPLSAVVSDARSNWHWC